MAGAVVYFLGLFLFVKKAVRHHAVRLFPRSTAFYIRSKIPAAPMPVPTHMVTMPYFRLLRRIAWITVAERIAPVAPSGWPSAIAPPIGLTLAGSRPRSWITASDCAA